MRYLVGFLCVCAMSVAPLVGCSETAGDGGTGGDGGAGGSMGQVFPCTEQGIHDAIIEGGGPHFFACDGPTAIAALFEIDNDVILDGEGKLETDSIEVLAEVTAELRGFHVRDQFIWADRGGVTNYGDLRLSNCSVAGFSGGGVFNDGALMLVNSRVSGNSHVGIWNNGTLNITGSSVSGNASSPDYEDVGAGIHNTGMLTITDSTVSKNRDYAPRGSGGIYNAGGFVTLTNSTISGNDFWGAGGIINTGALTIASSTVSDSVGGDASIHNEGTATVMNSLIDGDCEGDISSNGYNIESPGNTCGFDTNKGDQVSVPDPKLGPLANNGGLTETQALESGSPAINQIPGAACEVETDQRGQPRPEPGGTMCDVGAFEVQP
jgi:hypothetical protein